MSQLDKIKNMNWTLFYIAYTSTISLARSSNNFAGYTATAHGFGKYTDVSDVSDFLRYASVSVISHATVSSVIKY